MLKAFDRILLATLVVSLFLSATPAVKSQEAGKAEETGKTATEVYQAQIEQWKSMLKELRRLQADYGTATEEEAAEIRGRWDELVEQGEAMIQKIRQSGPKAYAEAPGEDRELEQFLIKMLRDDMEHDRYEQAAELSQALLDAGCRVKRLYNVAGVAAFATNDYENAEQYLEQAESVGLLSELGENFKQLIPEYKEYWEKEKTLRQQEAEQDDLPRVRITTNKGEIVVELFENEAPETVGNFVSLVDDGFYDGLTFHRVMPGFMAQGGCPLGTGAGGPDYEIYCECHKPDHRKHFRGSLSMAHRGRDTGGSQFFLTFVPTAHLNGEHTVFGRVIEGMEVLGKLERVDPSDTEAVPDKIVEMEVIRRRDHEYKPHKVQ